MNRWVLLHGFTQTHQAWWPVIAALTRRWSTDGTPAPALVLPDLPGHGLSSPPTGSVAATGADVARLIGAEPTVLVGYSMGARVALSAAAAASEICTPAACGIGALVLIGGTAGIESSAERAERRSADEARAERLEDDGVAAFLEDWVRLDLFGGYSPADLSYRRRNNATGLAASLRRHGTGAQVPLWDALNTITIPTLVIAGARDRKYVEIGRRLEQRLPRGTFVTIEDADHAAHLQRPDEFAAITTSWLNALA